MAFPGPLIRCRRERNNSSVIYKKFTEIVDKQIVDEQSGNFVDAMDDMEHIGEQYTSFNDYLDQVSAIIQEDKVRLVARQPGAANNSSDFFTMFLQLRITDTNVGDFGVTISQLRQAYFDWLQQSGLQFQNENFLTELKNRLRDLQVEYRTETIFYSNLILLN